LIDLSKVQNSLGEMGTELDKLLKNWYLYKEI
jgi:hypothetical protein